MKGDKTLILVIFSIIVLSFLVHRQFMDLQKSLSKIKLTEFKTEELLPTEEKEEPEITYKEFVTPDGKVKLKYSSDWTEGEQELLAAFNPEGVITQAKVLFFIHKIELEKPTVAFLMVQEIYLTDLEEIIKEIKKTTEETGGEVEIVNSEKKEKEAVLEVKYKREESYNLHSKEKIFFLEDKSYSITFFTPEESWLEIAKEGDEILNSAQFAQ